MGKIKTIKSVPVIPFALMTGSIAGALGLIWSLLMVVFGLSLLKFVPYTQLSVAIAGGFLGAIILIIFVTIGTFVAGFIIYALVAVIYNLLAPKIGGIELELD